MSYLSASRFGRFGNAFLCVALFGFCFLFLSLFIIGSDKSIGHIYYGLVVAPLIFCFDVRVFFSLFKSRIFLSFLFLLVCLLLSSFWGSGEVVSYLKRVVYIFLFFYSVVFFCSVGEQFVRSLGFFILITTLVFVLVYSTDFYLSGGQLLVDRLHGWAKLSNPIFFSSYVLFASLISLFYAMKSDALKVKVGFFICAVVLLIAAGLSLSRGPFVGYLFGAIFYLLFFYAEPKRRLFVVVVCSLAFFLMYSIGVFDALIDRGGSYRLGIWLAQIDKLVDCGLVFGCGAGADDSVVVDNVWIEHSHSLLVSVFFQGGLVGLGLLMIASAVTAKYLYAHRKESVVLWAGLLIFGIGSSMTDGVELLMKVHPYWFFVYLPLAIVVYFEIHGPRRLKEY